MVDGNIHNGCGGNEVVFIVPSVEDVPGNQRLNRYGKGTVQDDINATNVKRHGDAAKRKEFLLGTNQFPNFTEKSEGKRPVGKACCCAKAADSKCEPVRSAWG